MKKALCLLTLLCILLLAGCSAAKPVQEAIAQIGTVSLDSLSAIENAEQLYAALSPEDQAKVENYAILTAAREAYDRLYRLDQAEKAIDAIGAVTLDSLTAIENAEQLYGALSPEDQALIGNSSVLTAAREEYGKLALVDQTVDAILAVVKAMDNHPGYYEKAQYILVRDMVFLLEELEAAGLSDRLSPLQTQQLQDISGYACECATDWYYSYYDSLEGCRDALTVYTALTDMYPDLHPDVKEDLERYLGYACGDLARLYLDAGDYDAAWDTYLQYYPYVFQEDKPYLIYYDFQNALENLIEQPGDKKTVIGNYTHALELMDEMEARIPDFASVHRNYRYFREEVEEELEELWAAVRPKNGAILVKTYTDFSFAKFEFAAGDLDVCFKIYETSKPELYAMVYVAANSTGSILLPNGSFAVHCAVGSAFDWVDAESLFGDSTEYYLFTDVNPQISGGSQNSIFYNYRGVLKASMTVGGAPNPDLKKITPEEY